MLIKQKSPSFQKVLKAAKFLHANKTEESITSQKLGSHDFWQIANSVLNKGKSAIPLLFNGPKRLSSASYKAKSFAENLSKNSNLQSQKKYVAQTKFFSANYIAPFPHHINVDLHMQEDGIVIPQH